MKITILFALLSAVASQVYHGQPLGNYSMNFLVRVEAKFPPNMWRRRGLLQQGGGTIVSDRMILTAAHVVADATYFQNLPAVVEVDAGTKRLDRVPQSGAQVQWVKNERVHILPRWRNLVTGQIDPRYDVALIFLVKPLTMGRMVKKAILGPPPINPDFGDACHVMGWGLTTKMVYDQRHGPHLQVKNSSIQAMIGTVRKLHPIQCETPAYLVGYFHRTHHFCYGCTRRDLMRQAPGKGDSGGPVVCMHNNRQYVVAVHSLGCNDVNGACRPETPSAGVKIDQGLKEWMQGMNLWQWQEDQKVQPRCRLTWNRAEVDGGLPGDYMVETCKQL